MERGEVCEELRKRMIFMCFVYRWCEVEDRAARMMGMQGRRY